MSLVAAGGQILQVNRATCEFLGYSEQELMTLSIAGITHPDDLEANVKQLERALAGDICSYQLEKRFIHKRGHIVWGLLSVALVRGADGQPLYVIDQVQNITERERAQNALRASEEPHSRAVATHPDVICRSLA